MGCDSSHLEPTAAEKERKHAATLLLVLLDKLNLPKVSWVEKAAKDPYGVAYEDDKDKSIRVLCDTMRMMTTIEIETVMYGYNLKDANERKWGRMLAEWWEAHQASDLMKRLELINTASKKLTGDEWVALGLPTLKELKSKIQA